MENHPLTNIAQIDQRYRANETKASNFRQILVDLTTLMHQSNNQHQIDQKRASINVLLTAAQNERDQLVPTLDQLKMRDFLIGQRVQKRIDIKCHRISPQILNDLILQLDVSEKPWIQHQNWQKDNLGLPHVDSPFPYYSPYRDQMAQEETNFLSNIGQIGNAQDDLAALTEWRITLKPMLIKYCDILDEILSMTNAILFYPASIERRLQFVRQFDGAKAEDGLAPQIDLDMISLHG